MPTRIATDRAISHGSTRPSMIRDSITNGLENGTNDRTTTTGEPIELRPIAAAM